MAEAFNSLRSAAILGADFIFTIGRRYARQATDTVKSWCHVPLWEFPSLDALRTPYACQLVGVEMTAEAVMLGGFDHPHSAMMRGPHRQERNMAVCIARGTRGWWVQVDGQDRAFDDHVLYRSRWGWLMLFRLMLFLWREVK